MIAVIAKNIQLYSFPLIRFKEGYDEVVKRVCQIESKRQRWTGVCVAENQVWTTGFYPHGKEFDLEFYGEKSTSGFLTRDYGDTLQLRAGKIPKLNDLMASTDHVRPRQMLYVVGSLLGIPFSLATCEVEKITIMEQAISADRLRQIDEHSTGSPVFNNQLAIVGMLMLYMESSDRMIIRSITATPQGLLK